MTAPQEELLNEPAARRAPLRRNTTFDLLRLLFAVLVLLAHAPELTDGNRSRELLVRLAHTSITLGTIGVDGFFLLSGFLILQSWERSPKLAGFLEKRVLRIVPGFVVASLLSTLVIGLLAPRAPGYFQHLTFRYPLSLLLLDSPNAPPAFPGLPYTDINASLWTISYEFRCYVLTAILGLAGIFQRPRVCLAVTAVLVAIMFKPQLAAPFGANHLVPIMGYPVFLFWLVGVFCTGGCFYLFRQSIPYRPLLALLAVVTLVAVGVLAPLHLEPFLVVLGGYLMFYLTRITIPGVSAIKHFPDISYGVYLYGWPVESLWIWYRRGSPWIAFVASTAICFILGWLSWHYVERPMLALKRRPSVVLLEA